jgi:hypothetical protein
MRSWVQIPREAQRWEAFFYSQRTPGLKSMYLLVRLYQSFTVPCSSSVYALEICHFCEIHVNNCLCINSLRGCLDPFILEELKST